MYFALKLDTDLELLIWCGWPWNMAVCKWSLDNVFNFIIVNTEYTQLQYIWFVIIIIIPSIEIQHNKHFCQGNAFENICNLTATASVEGLMESIHYLNQCWLVSQIGRYVFQLNFIKNWNILVNEMHFKVLSAIF